MAPTVEGYAYVFLHELNRKWLAMAGKRDILSSTDEFWDTEKNPSVHIVPLEEDEELEVAAVREALMSKVRPGVAPDPNNATQQRAYGFKLMFYRSGSERELRDQQRIRHGDRLLIARKEAFKDAGKDAAGKGPQLRRLQHGSTAEIVNEPDTVYVKPLDEAPLPLAATGPVDRLNECMHVLHPEGDAVHFLLRMRGAYRDASQRGPLEPGALEAQLLSHPNPAERVNGAMSPGYVASVLKRDKMAMDASHRIAASFPCGARGTFRSSRIATCSWWAFICCRS